MASDNRLPVLGILNLSRANVKMKKSKRLIVLPVKVDLRANTALDDLIEAFQSLRDVVMELALESVSTAKTNTIDNLSWTEIQNRLTDSLGDLP